MSREILWKIICQEDIRDTLYKAIHSHLDDYDKKYNLYKLDLERYNDIVQATLAAKSYRDSYYEVYRQILDEIRRLDINIQEQKSLYDKEYSKLEALDRDINKSIDDINMEISNHNSYSASLRSYQRCAIGNGGSINGKEYALELLKTQREKQVLRVNEIHKEIDSLIKERDTNSRIFSDMNATIISWMDDDKNQQTLSDKIDAQLVELQKITHNIDDVKQQIKDVEANIEKCRNMK